MIDHDRACRCAACKMSDDITQADRDYLANAWAQWIGATDGEANKLRAGRNGAPGSPRWVALKAISAARRGGGQGAAG